MKWLVLACLVTGCAAGIDLDEAQDADEASDGKLDAPTQTCSTVRCGDPEADAILFPGNPACGPAGCERDLASDDLYIPPRNGRPWGDTYEAGLLPARVLSGYSSGRIALLRRLALVGDGEHAILLDPSWEDGARNFLGTGPVRGADLVATWLRDDPSRQFTLLYSTRSVGWASYAALLDSDVGDRVRVCSVDVPHLRIPLVEGLATLLTDPLAWDNGTCRVGSGS